MIFWCLEFGVCCNFFREGVPFFGVFLTNGDCSVLVIGEIIY